MFRDLPWTRLCAGIIVSAVAIAIVLMRVDLDDVAEAFRTADYRWLLIAIAGAFLTVPIRAQRWRLLCRPATLTFTRAFGILSVGAALTSLLPLRLGDIVRVYLVGEMERRSKVWALATIIVERIFDIVALVLITLLLLPFISLPDWTVASARVMGVLALAGIAGMCVVWFGRSRLEARIGPLADQFARGPFERLRSLARHLIDGLAVFSQPSQLLGVATWTAVLWLTTGGVLWATLMAFDVTNSPSVAMLLVIVSAAAVAVPLSPSAVGIYHAAIVEALVVVTTIGNSTATSVAITAHVLLFAPPVICGFASFWFVPGIADRLLLLRRARRESAATQIVNSGPLPPG